MTHTHTVYGSTHTDETCLCGLQMEREEENDKRTRLTRGDGSEHMRQDASQGCENSGLKFSF